MLHLLHQRALIAKLAIAVLGVTCLSVAMPTQTEAAPTKAVKASAKAAAPGRSMTAAELRQLYSGKTWVWSNGGGYFDRSGRFKAIAGKDYVRGTWQASNSGKMCFGGQWVSGVKRSQNRTCFTHRTAGSAIYQRKHPSGTWYIFKHSPVRSDDEYSKLVRGDRVSDQLREVQAVLPAD